MSSEDDRRDNFHLMDLSQFEYSWIVPEDQIQSIKNVIMLRIIQHMCLTNWKTEVKLYRDFIKSMLLNEPFPTRKRSDIHALVCFAVQTVVKNSQRQDLVNRFVKLES